MEAHTDERTPSSSYQWNLGEQSCVFAGMKTGALLALVMAAAVAGAVVGFLLLCPGHWNPS
jgi:hypothetical protein